ncbi:VCBS repeat-containing protein [Andreprevotia lacus DSM 23236]|uniref:VCBS repeat-containing protein n=1 Tax=Andreprevotia lacus DSM 23236 TaxID=1121001 RepID=A0A1W1Y0N6_9NEIS|nr:retention module-containing protein [Andreprevotia lacus]SMC29733.1 VCBS repeat-containing protein [Andreprevotia lacus DSM 23236]
MATPSQQATIVQLNGQAFIRDATGKMTPLHSGETLNQDQVLVTSPDGEVVVLLPNGDTQTVGPDRSVLLDAQFMGAAPDTTEAAVAPSSVQGGTAQIDQIVAQGGDLSTDLEATAAGLTGGGDAGNGTHTFIRVGRISEEAGSTAFGTPGTPIGGAGAAEQNGQNHAPVAVDDNSTGAANDGLTSPEDTPLTISPLLLLSNDGDPDGDPLTIVSVQDPVHGTLSIDANNNIVFTPDPNYNGPASFSYTIDDGRGGTATATVNLNITPVNDPATVSNDAGTVKEDTPTQTTVGGTLTITDVDTGEQHVVAQNVSNPYGTFTVDADGNWSFTIDNTSPTVQALAEGQTQVLTFDVTSVDGTGTGVVTITVVGTNDNAVITAHLPGDDAGTVKEDTILATGGKLDVADPDTGESAVIAQTDTTGTYGSFSILADGTWTYTLNNASPVVQALNEGESRTEVFQVQSQDGSDTHFVTVTVLGTNDNAVITAHLPGDDAGTVKEDTILSTGGKLDVADPDAGQSAVVAQSNTTGTYGSFSIAADGTWTYSLNNGSPIVQALNEGESRTETFQVQSLDGTDTHTVTVTILGTNDAALIGGNDSGTVKEDTTLVTGGILTVSDVDTGQSSLVAETVTGTYGTFSVDANGNWSYVLNNSSPIVQALNDGDTRVETFAVQSVDGTTHTVTVNVLGTNDGEQLPPPRISVSLDSEGDTVFEGNYAVFNVHLSYPSTTDVTFTPSQVSGTATVGTDTSDTLEYWNGSAWVAVSGGITIPAGQTDVQVRVATVADGIYEGNENFSLHVDVTSGSTSNTSADATAVIIDGDKPPEVSISVSGEGSMVHEGDYAVFNVHLSGSSSTDVVFTPSLVSGTATVGTDTGTALEYSLNGTDWFAVGTGVTIPAGQTDVQVRVATVADGIYEGNENFSLHVDVTSSNTSNSSADATATIVDADSPPQVTVSVSGEGSMVHEGDYAVFNVHLSGSSSTDVVFTPSLVSGTATVGTDTGTALEYWNGSAWVAISGGVTIPAGQTDVQVRVATVADGIYEGNENFSLHVDVTSSNTSNTSADATATIIDADSPPVVSVSVSSEGSMVPEGAYAVFNVHLSGPSSGAISFTPSLHDGTAIIGTDTSTTLEYWNGSAWTVVSGDITLAAGQTDVQVRVATIDDSIYEGNENFSLQVHVTSGSTSNTDASATAIIVDNDAQPVGHDDGYTVQEASTNALASVLGNDTPSGLHVAKFATDGAGGGAVSADGSHTITTSLGGTVTMHADGTFTYTIPDLHHTGTAVDSFYYQATDGNANTAWTKVSVNVTDTGPTAHDDTVSLNTVSTDTVNLVLVVDSSGSIGTTNLNTIKAALSHLMTTYGSALQSVMLVDFDDNARVFHVNTDGTGSVWLTQSQAESKYSSITSGGNTDYDDAIKAVQDNYGTPPTAAKTYVYFVSDGEPTGSDGTNPNTIEPSERADWVNFLTGKVDEVYAIGIGSGVSQTDSDLLDVAWSSSGNDAGNVKLISTADDLSGTLTSIAQSNGNVTSNDDFGLDGAGSPKLVSVSYDADGSGPGAATVYTFDATHHAYTINLGAGRGTLVLHDDGSYTYTPASGSSNGAPFTVQYTIQDADGSQSTASMLFDPNGTPVVGTAPSITVSEEGLPGANPDTTGNTDTTNLALRSGTIAITDPDSTDFNLRFAAPTATLTSGGTALSWSGAGTGVLIGMANGVEIIRISQSDTHGGYQVQLSGSLDHATAGQEDVKSFGVLVTVDDGAAANNTTTTTLTVNVEDDSPINMITNGLAQNTTSTSFEGTLASIGADKTGAHIVLSGSVPSGLTSNGVAITYSLSSDGSTLTAKAGTNTVFTLTGHADGSYSYDQVRTLDLSVVTSNLQSSVGAGGPQAAYYMYTDGSFGSTENAKDWAVKITGSDSINPSTQGMGVSNNLFQTGETMRFEFDDEHASTVGGSTPNLAYATKIGVTDLTGSESLAWTAYFTDGSHASGVVTAGSLVSGAFTITSPNGLYLDYVDLAPGSSTSIRLTSVTNYVLDDTHTKDLNFGFTAYDGDGDTSNGSLTITSQNSATLTGDATHTALGGGNANNTLLGTAGNDILTGGAGNDTLTGGLGADVFRWGVNDHGTAATPSNDVVTDFATTGASHDQLDLRDLLTSVNWTVNAGHTTAQLATELDGYLSVSESGTTTTLSVKAGSSSVTETIQLQNVTDLVDGTHTVSHDVIVYMLDHDLIKHD